MPSNFHQRCQLALTHPVTLGAVALLLVNDWLLKPLWHSDWTTGKLSDLAWMVFFPPLLLFVLSLAARGNSRAQRVAYIAAYLGLPVLYAAYNTFAPLHDWIMGGFMVLSGSSAGSPLDPADSLVILPAMAAALWVWHGTAHSRAGLRTRLHLYAVVIAALATVATSNNHPAPDAWNLGISDNGVVVMGGGRGGYFPSYDGGLTWGHQPDKGDIVRPIRWGAHEVETPRGNYSVEDNVIYRATVGGQRQAVHSLRYLTEGHNFWAQDASTKSERRRVTGLVSDQRRMLTRYPYGMVYDPASGNIVVSLGILGVVVGDAKENWTPVSVGPYTPFDASFLGRARWLFTPEYWFAAVAVPLAFITGTLVFAEGRTGTQQSPRVERQPINRRALGAFVTLLLALPAFWFIATVGPDWIRPVAVLLSELLSSMLWLVVILLVVAWPFMLFAYARGAARQGKGRRFIALFFAVLGASITTALLEPFRLDVYFFNPFEFFFWFAGIVFAVLAFFVYQPSRQQLSTVAVAFVVMNVLMPLPFFLWLLGGINLATATVGSGALLAATGYALYRRLVWQAEEGMHT